MCYLKQFTTGKEKNKPSTNTEIKWLGLDNHYVDIISYKAQAKYIHTADIKTKIKISL